MRRGSLEETAKEQRMKYSEFFRNMVRVYEDYQEEKAFRTLQEYGALRSQEMFDGEEVLFDSLYQDR